MCEPGACAAGAESRHAFKKCCGQRDVAGLTQLARQKSPARAPAKAGRRGDLPDRDSWRAAIVKPFEQSVAERAIDQSQPGAPNVASQPCRRIRRLALRGQHSGNQARALAHSRERRTGGVDERQQRRGVRQHRARHTSDRVIRAVVERAGLEPAIGAQWPVIEVLGKAGMPHVHERTARCVERETLRRRDLSNAQRDACACGEVEMSAVGQSNEPQRDERQVHRARYRARRVASRL